MQQVLHQLKQYTHIKQLPATIQIGNSHFPVIQLILNQFFVYLTKSLKDLKAHINPVLWYWISLSVANADASLKLLTRHNENDRRRSILQVKYTK